MPTSATGQPFLWLTWLQIACIVLFDISTCNIDKYCLLPEQGPQKERAGPREKADPGGRSGLVD
jgi:hypothetical protein